MFETHLETRSLGETDLNIRTGTEPGVLSWLLRSIFFVWLRYKLIFAQSIIADTFIIDHKLFEMLLYWHTYFLGHTMKRFKYMNIYAYDVFFC